MSHLSDNLEVLRVTDPALAAIVADSRGGRLSIHASRDGAPSAQCDGHWVHSSYDPRKEAAGWASAQLKQWRADEVGVVLGVGLLYHVEALLAAKPPEARLAVVVPEPGLLKDAAAARPFGPWCERIEWLYGTAEEMAERLSSIGLPLRFFTYQPAAGLHQAVHHELETALKCKMAERANGRLHVAVVGPIYGGSLPIARHVVRALEALGHRVTWLDHSLHHQSYEAFGSYKDVRHRLTMQSRFADVLSLGTITHLAENPPDLVLAMAQAPLTLAVLEHLRKKKFLTAMWFVENYRHLTYWQQMASGYDYWFVFQQGDCPSALKRAGARHVHYLPMAADPAVHRPLELTEAERREFGADVSFVGAGYQNRRTLLPRWLSREWTFKLWGNEWEGAQNLASVIQRNGARIDTETCMKVFNATAINLNLHSCDGDDLDGQADFVNPRTFELAACGAFQLVDRRSLMGDLFADGELVQFDRAGDVPALIRRWLPDAENRKAVAQAAQTRVLRDHTYRRRMSDLLMTIGLDHPDRIGSLLRGERSADHLAMQDSTPPELIPLLRYFPQGQRVELKDVAAQIRARSAAAPLQREELLILMLDSYRAETRDLV